MQVPAVKKKGKMTICVFLECNPDLFLSAFSELYGHTGCRFHPFNTIYQLYDEKVKGRLEGVTDMLMMPEYLVWKR